MNCFLNSCTSVTMGTLSARHFQHIPVVMLVGNWERLQSQPHDLSARYCWWTCVCWTKLQDKLPCRETHWGILLPFLQWCLRCYKQRRFWLVLAALGWETSLVCSCIKPSLFFFAGCPDGKKVEFITSLLDALTTDMVQAINSAAPTGGGRWVRKALELNPPRWLLWMPVRWGWEGRVVLWAYFHSSGLLGEELALHHQGLLCLALVVWRAHSHPSSLAAVPP